MIRDFKQYCLGVKNLTPSAPYPGTFFALPSFCSPRNRGGGPSNSITDRTMTTQKYPWDCEQCNAKHKLLIVFLFKI